MKTKVVAINELKILLEVLAKTLSINMYENTAMPDFRNSKEDKPLIASLLLIKEIGKFRYSAGFWYVEGENRFYFIIQIKDTTRPTAEQILEMKPETCPEEFKELIYFQPRISCSELYLEAWMWEILYSVRQGKEIKHWKMDLRGVTKNAIITYENKRYFREMMKRQNMPIIDIRNIENAVKSTHTLFVKYANGEVDLTTKG